MEHVMVLWSMVAHDWKLLVVVAALLFMLLVTLAFALAATLLRLANNRKARRWGRLEGKWEALLPEVVAGLRAPAELLARVHPRERLYFVDFLYKQALQAGAAQRQALGRLAAPFLAPLAGRTEGGDAERRARALQTLALLAPAPHAPLLLRALADPAPLVAMIAARHLAASRQPAHVDAVLDTLHRFTEWSPKFMTSLLTSMGPAAAPRIRQRAADPALTPAERGIALDALGRLGDGDALPLAAALLARETDADVLAAALRLVRAVGGAADLEPVRRLAAHEDFAVRGHAIAALGQLGDATDVPRLKAGLRDASPWVVLHAARGLRLHGELNFLRQAAQRGTVPDVALQVLAET
jgi:HEAT repeat protein